MQVPEFPISVVMPVLNGEATIRQALMDLQANLLPRDEILVIDDGSSDQTADLLLRAQEEEDRVRVIRTEGIGLVRALNLGLTEANHRWVARADADDRYPVDRLLCQRRAVREGVVLVSGDYVVTGGERNLGEFPSALTAPFVAMSLIHPQRIPHPGVLFDRDAVLEVGAYREADFPAEDIALWLRLATVGDFVGVPHVVVHWSMRKGSVTHTHQVRQRQNVAQLLRRSFPTSILSRVTLEEVQVELRRYASERSEGIRGILLARDLRALRARGLDGEAYSEVSRYLLKSPSRTLLASWQVAMGKQRRRRFRGRIS